MTFTDVLFFLLAAILIISAAVSVFSVKAHNILQSGIVSIVLIAVVFFSLGSDYIGILYLLLNAGVTGGILVFLYFKKIDLETGFKGSSILNVLGLSIFTALFTGTLVTSRWSESLPLTKGLNSMEAAFLFQTDYLLPFIVLVLIIFTVFAGLYFKPEKN